MPSVIPADGAGIYISPVIPAVRHGIYISLVIPAAKAGIYISLVIPAVRAGILFRRFAFIDSGSVAGMATEVRPE